MGRGTTTDMKEVVRELKLTLQARKNKIPELN